MEKSHGENMPGAGSSFETKLKIHLRLWLYAGTLFVFKVAFLLCLFLKMKNVSLNVKNCSYICIK